MSAKKRKIVELQSECNSLSLDESIMLTEYLRDNDISSACLFLLEKVKELEAVKKERDYAMELLRGCQFLMDKNGMDCEGVDIFLEERNND